jgi:amino acid adenylation domain-containing protein
MTEPQQKLAGLSRQERAALFDLLRKKKEAAGSVLRIERRPDPAAPPPLSFAQLRLWFLDRLHPGDPTYNLSSVAQIRGELHLPSLVLALTGVADRHEALRTTFAVPSPADAEGSEPVQMIAPRFVPEVPMVDLRAMPDALRRPELQRLSAEETRRPFDLAAGPLLRATILRTGDQRHLLLLVMHHIVSDGWSMGLLVGESVTLYQGLLSGQPAVLPELRFQYADFALWQRDWLRGEQLQTQIDYWKEHLGGEPPELLLAADHPRPERRTPAGAQFMFQMPPAVTARLAAFAREENGTLFFVLLAAFEALLHRLSGQDDFCVGTPIANRNQSGTERLIGFFVNTLVLRADLSGNPAFRELVGRVRHVALGAYSHQDLPFEKLVAELQPERTPGRNPLFQVLLSFQKIGETPPAVVSAVDVGEVVLDSGTARLDLSLSIAEKEDGLIASFEHSLDLFSAVTLERWTAHLLALLEGASNAPDLRLSELPLLAAAERFQLTVEWNDTRTAPPQAWRSVPRQIAAQAERAPGAVAVEAGAGTLTYGELVARAASLARHLRSLGLGSESPDQSPVAVLLERTLDLPAALLGVWEAGAAYLPLEPGSPAERLAYMLENSGARVVVTSRDLAPALPAGVRPLYVEDVDRDDASPRREPHDPRPGDLAYIIYTSGSTGRPKGVMVEHGSLAAVLGGLGSGAGAGLGWTAADAIPCLAPFAFDISLFELLSPLLVGGRAILVELRPAFDLAGLLGLLGRITRLHAVPALMRRIVDDVLARGLAAPFLRTVLTGGDAVPVALLVDLRRAFPAAEVRVLYGPTEGTIVCASHRSSPEDRGSFPPLGRPLPDAVLLLCDHAGNPVPIFAAGEIWIGGPGVSRGYLGLPELTAARFPSVNGERFYRTGDMARRRADGTLEFLGRADEQVKIRGFRIEPGEIEAALAAHPGLRAAAVVATAREDGGERRLVAYVVPHAEPGLPGPASAELLDHLRTTLPEHMIPAAVVALPDLPLTANGKVDRRALANQPAPGWSLASKDRVAPRTPREETLAAIFAEVLNIPAPGVLDDFFALGGHSLLAMRLVSRTRELLGVELPLRCIFETPTVAGLAAALDGELGLEQPPLPPILPERGSGPSDSSPPLSFGQERLWFLDRLEPGTTSLNMPFSLRLKGPLNRSALAGALAAVVARHDVLRTVYRDDRGIPRQTVRPVINVSLPVADLAGLPAGIRDTEAARLAAAETGISFDLANGPVLRALLVALEPTAHALLLTVHHIAADGWSMGVLTRELTDLYTAGVEGRPSPLPPLPVQYADFARWQRDWLRGDVLAAQTAWWRQQLGGSLPPLELPTDRPRPAVQTFRGASARLHIPTGLTAELHALALGAGASLFMVLLAAFQVLLQRWSGQDDVLTGAPIAGRRHRETEGLIGFFLNHLVLRGDLAGTPTFRDLLARTRETTLGAFAHQDVPFEALLADLQPERDLSRTPLFQVFFNLANFAPEEIRLPGGITLEPLGGSDAESKFDLTVYAAEGDGAIGFNLVYNADLFDAPRMEELLRQYHLLLANITRDPAAPVGSFPLVTAEAAVLLPDPTAPLGAEWRGAVHTLFAERARLHPDKPAVIDPGAVWSYGDLAAAANRLALRLHAAGVQRGDRVAIWAHRSSPAAWAVLGTLRAGAAFVMLDPTYPPARLVDILRLAAPTAWLEIAAAGPPPPAVEEYIRESAAAGTLLCRQLLPGGGPDPTDPTDPSDALPTVGPDAVGPDDLAYVAFTSGSTGIPKGILGRHGPLSHFLPWQCERFGLTADDRYSMLSGLAHDPLQRDLFTPLCTGGTLIAPPAEDVLTPGRLAAWAARERISVAHLTPAMAQLLTETTAGTDAPVLTALRYVLLVGDVLTRLDVERIGRLAPAATCVNLYGSTETQRAVGYHVAQRTEPGEPARQILPLGRGMRDVQLLVVNSAGALAGIGEVGEIWVRSPHLARGYLGDAALTEERFRINPFTGIEGDRVYRTGDLGRYLPNGEVTFAGRADQQVKIRGFRIELGEIEAILGGLPGVREAVVLARGEGSEERRLVAYVTPLDPEAPPDTTALRDGLRAQLPAYMVPSAFVALDRLPVTPNGKLDRKALAKIEPEGQDAGLAASYIEPSSDLERRIAALWREVLGVEQVGVRHNFFDLGGHSLLLVRLHARLQEELGRELPLVDLFMHPNIEALARHLEQQTGGGGGPAREEGARDRAQRQIEAARRQKEQARMRRGGRE